MNAHAVQSVKEQAEVATFMSAASNIISSQNGLPIIALIQDALVGSYLGTRQGTLVGLDLLFNACVSANTFENLSSTLKRAAKWYPEYLEKDGTFKVKTSDATKNGEFPKVDCKILFSTLFAPDFCYKKETDDGEVKIEEGIILPDSAPLGRQTLAPKAGNSIVHVLWIDRGEEVAAEFIYSLQQMVYCWYNSRNLSIGTEDCLLDVKENTVERELSALRVKCAVEENSGNSKEEKEASITQALNSVVNIGHKLTKEGLAGGKDNGFGVLVKSGAKGGFINLAQILCLVGQQNVLGKRIQQAISNGERCLPHFACLDLSPEARGFIKNSYYSGMDMLEVFFAAMAGREGVIDTAVKTAESGYIQRKIGHKVQSAVTQADGTIRMCNGKILQFAFGGDGFDAKKLIPVGKELFFIDIARISREMCLGKKTRKLNEEEIELVVSEIKLNLNSVLSKTAHIAKQKLKDHLSNIVFYPKKLEELRNKVTKAFFSSLISSGEAVGLVATCNMGEPQTQLTLNSFRLSGIGEKAVLAGVPKFRELMVASSKQKHSSCVVAVEDLDDKKDKAEALKIFENQRKVFEHKVISDFVESTELRYFFGKEEEFSKKQNASEFVHEEFVAYKPQWWVKFYVGLSEKSISGFEEGSVDSCVWVVDVKVKKEMLYKYRMTLQELANIINDGEDVYCIPSPVGELSLIIYPNYQRDVNEELEKISKVTKVSPIFTDGNINYFFARDVVLPYILQKKVCGIEGITKIFPLLVREEGVYRVDTQGSNFREVLNTPGVIPEKTTSDDLHQVLEVLGIESARFVLFEEFRKVLSGGSYVDPRHIMLLVDSMTRDGKLTPTSRDGVERSVGPLEIGSFEKMGDNFIESSQFGESDHIKSTSACVFMGKPVDSGTSNVQVIRKEQEEILEQKKNESLLSCVVADVAAEIRKMFVLPCK